MLYITVRQTDMLLRNQLGTLLLMTVIVYANLTAMEWFVHKYVMHGYDRVNVPLLGELIQHESDAHWQHHNEVRSDMTLDIDNKQYREQGLFFQYKTTLFFTGVLIVLLSAQFKALGVTHSTKQVVLIAVVATLVYSFLWNNFHARLHGAGDIFISPHNGVSNKYQDLVVRYMPMWWFRWMMLNHAQHHAVKGRSKGNYNIILPGFDYVMGTYNVPPCFDNTTFCEDSDLGACDQPKGCFDVKDKDLHVSFEN